jgi:hypothetical protein
MKRHGRERILETSYSVAEDGEALQREDSGDILLHNEGRRSITERILEISSTVSHRTRGMT